MRISFEFVRVIKGVIKGIKRCLTGRCCIYKTVNLETFEDPSDSLLIKSIFRIRFKLDLRGRIIKEGHVTLNLFDY